MQQRVGKGDGGGRGGTSVHRMEKGGGKGGGKGIPPGGKGERETRGFSGGRVHKRHFSVSAILLTRNGNFPLLGKKEREAGGGGLDGLLTSLGCVDVFPHCCCHTIIIIIVVLVLFPGTSLLSVCCVPSLSKRYAGYYHYHHYPCSHHIQSPWSSHHHHYPVQSEEGYWPCS